MSQGKQQQQQGEQEQQRPTARLEHVLADIRKVQNLLEIQYPHQGSAINLQREAGDLVWKEIQEHRQKQQQAQQQ